MKDETTRAIRVATPADAEALLAVYAPYVQNTAVTFETAVPAAADFRRRIAATLPRYPYLVARDARGVAGYAYTGAFVGRAAYDWSAAVSIYLAADRRGRGWGRRLYTALETLSRGQGIANLYACIGMPAEADDPYLTDASAAFHAHLGYRPTGTFRRCGYKFARWYDMIWMEKIIGEHRTPMPPPIPFDKLPAETVAAALAAAVNA
ncbi:N-acetyltransferase family protein [Pseudoramibacter faecis]|uniref:GNAT family N-acetyltransferase n=1 Tax=Pseudoramibacter faecis TaxID=3108534 RepID=UPI002E76FFEE|nr:N-acetyltransferase family protein [Pseudoramibacter sp. HA2172]